jgi:hypothetical protein
MFVEVKQIMGKKTSEFPTKPMQPGRVNAFIRGYIKAGKHRVIQADN